MSVESDTRHFTWFLNVLHAFLAGSELLWTLFYLKKCIKLSHRIHKNPDFVTVTERIDIKIGGHIEGKQYMHF